MRGLQISGGLISARERCERTPEEIQRGIEVFEDYVEVAANRSVHARMEAVLTPAPAADI